jgi:phosphotransferase system IIB component
VALKEPRKAIDKGQEDTSIAQTDQSNEREDETVRHTETQTEKKPANPDEEVMEELAGFQEVTYRRNSSRQRQQIIIGTSKDSEIKAEKKKAWNWKNQTAPQCAWHSGEIPASGKGSIYAIKYSM